ncbi:ATP-binding protein [Embleya sp. NPDC020630]|uniref:ATP-binding protein n=1 Tax=Embleya sp. NPDC020630 TaxID=3363979 RepID=UPI0037B2DD73
MTTPADAVPGESNFMSVPINPGRVLRAIARIGYTPESAICDIVDNSVAANANRIVIELEREPEVAENRRNSAAGYIIADNGAGMSKQQLLSALGLGVDRQYAEGSLGKYGLGLKSAGLSQGDRIEVISAREGHEWNKIVLDLPHIEQVGAFVCEMPELNEADRERIDRMLPGVSHGTLVSIEKVHKRNHPSIRKTREALTQKLGLTYFYFLQDGQNSLDIMLDGEAITPFDPLFTGSAEENGNIAEGSWDGLSVRWLERPRLITLDAENGVQATLEATQLVHPPAFENSAEIRKRYMIGAKHYGFYVYRNKRLIRHGERFGLIPTEQDFFAFRGRILIDDSADDAFNIDVKKSEILLSEEAEGALDEATYEARRASRAAWRNATKLLKKKADEDPISKATEALSEVEFPDLLPNDQDDVFTESKRKEREQKEAVRHPLREPERELAIKDGSRVAIVDQLDDNALWERAYDATLGTIVRINRNHRFMRMFDERFGSDADVVLLLHALFLSLAVSESNSVKNLQNIEDEVIDEVFQRYRNQASSAVYQATATALEKRFA